MRCHRIIALLLVLAAPLAAQVVVVNPSVTDREIDARHLTAMFQGGITTWDDGQPVVLVLADDSAADELLTRMTGRGRLVLLRSWKRLVFAGMGAMPLSASSSDEALGVVARTTGAMVLLDHAPEDPRWRVIPITLTAIR